MKLINLNKKNQRPFKNVNRLPFILLASLSFIAGCGQSVDPGSAQGSNTSQGNQKQSIQTQQLACRDGSMPDVSGACIMSCLSLKDPIGFSVTDAVYTDFEINFGNFSDPKTNQDITIGKVAITDDTPTGAYQLPPDHKKTDGIITLDIQRSSDAPEVSGPSERVFVKGHLKISDRKLQRLLKDLQGVEKASGHAGNSESIRAEDLCVQDLTLTIKHWSYDLYGGEAYVVFSHGNRKMWARLKF